MARPLRIDEPGTFYHVINRGNERRAVFRDNADHQGFLDRLGRCCERFEIDCHAYVLMDNHYHLLLRTHKANLSAALQWLQMAYSTWHNRRHARVGHLFQGRFKSFLVPELSYFQRLLLYVHRNPVRAKLVERVGDYPWSSYRALAYGRGGPEWFRPQHVYQTLDLDSASFRRAMSAYDEGTDDLWAELHYGLILGSAEVVEALRNRLRSQSDGEKPQLHRIQAHGLLQDRIAEYGRLLGVAQDELQGYRRPIRSRSRPLRDVLLYLLWRDGGLRLREIGDYFGIRYPAVSQARQRGQQALQKDRHLQQRLNLLPSRQTGK